VFLSKIFRTTKRDYSVQAGSLVTTGEFNVNDEERFPTHQLHSLIKLFNIQGHAISRIAITDVPQGAQFELSNISKSKPSPSFEIILRKDFRSPIRKFSYKVTNTKRLNNSYIQAAISNFETKLQNSTLVHNLKCDTQNK